MSKSKENTKPGDTIRIKYMYGEPNYTGKEGVVRCIDDIGQLHGSWGGLALNFYDDDWEIIKENN